MPIQVDGAFVRAPCPVPSCPACEPNSGSVPPSLSTKATRVERGRHCYAIKFVLEPTFPVSAVVSMGRRNTSSKSISRSLKAKYDYGRRFKENPVLIRSK